MRTRKVHWKSGIAALAVSCLFGSAFPVQGYTLFTAPASYDAIWRGTDGGGTIDGSAADKFWYTEAGAGVQALSYGAFGSVRPERYNSISGINNLLIGCAVPNSNTGLALNGVNLYIIQDTAARSWYPTPTTAPGLTVYAIGGYDARTYVTGGGSINQAAGKFLLNGESLFIGDSGTGTYNIEGGTFTITGGSASTDNIHIGSAVSTPGTGGTGTMNVAGSAAVVIPGTIYVGEKAAAAGVTNTGTVNQTGGLVNASALVINNGTYKFTGGSLQLTAAPLALNAVYANKTYNIEKNVTMTGGTLNMTSASGTWTGNLALSGNANFSLSASGYQQSTFGGSDTVITLADTASFYAANIGLAYNAADKVTLNMSGGTFQIASASALSESGTFIVNQTGGTFKGSGYLANGSGKVIMNLSGGSLSGGFASLATRGSVEMNISGNYNWTSPGQGIVDAYVAGTKLVVNQTGADSVINVSNFTAASQGNTCSATFNLSAGTFTNTNMSVTAGRPKFTGNMNLIALTDGAGKFTTPATGASVNLTNISDYSMNVTAGTLKITGTYKSTDHNGITLTVGTQTDSAGVKTNPSVTINALENVAVTYSGGTTAITSLTLPAASKITGTAGTLNVGSNTVQNVFAAPIDLSGTAVFNLTAVAAKYAILKNTITIKDSAVCNLGYMYAGQNTGDIFTVNLQGGTLKTVGGALGHDGKFILNQSGGTYNPNGGYLGNFNGSAVMTLSGGKMEGGFESLGTRSTTEINISGNYIWNDTFGEQVICYAPDNNTKVTMTQNGAASSVTFKDIKVGNSASGTGNFTYNLNEGTFNAGKWYINPSSAKVASNLNITDGTANIGTLEGISMKMSGGDVTVGTLTLKNGSSLSLVYGEDFSPLEITKTFSGNGNLNVSLADGFEVDPSSIYTLIEAKDGAVLDLSQMSILTSGNFYVDMMNGNVVLGGASALPEPAAWTLMILGIAGICVYRRKK